MADAVLLSLPLVAAIVVALTLAGVAWRRSVKKVRKIFILMCLSLAFLSATYWMELYSDTLGGKLFWNDLEYLVNVSLPPLFMMYTYTFLGRREVRWRITLPLLFVIPALTLALLWTNDLHHLFYTQVGLPDEPFSAFDHTYGIGFAIHSAYSLGLLFISVSALVYAYLRSSRMHRRQIMPVLVASLIPIVTLMIGLLDIVPLSLTYHFVVGFTAAAALIFIGSFKYELFDVVPLALEGIVEAVDDGIVVIDPRGRMLFVNDLLLRRMGRSESDTYARPLSALSPALAERLDEIRRGEPVHISLQGDGSTYLVKSTPILDSGGLLTSELLTLRDVTDERRTSERLGQANVKLSLLASVTRHDILNQLTVVRAYGELLAHGRAASKCESYGREIALAGASIERQLRFARDYQDLGKEEPRWQAAREVVLKGKELGLGGELEVNLDLEGIELMADPLLYRTFSILLDNTKRHGVHATEVRVGYDMRDGCIIIVYQDNGVGVDQEEKERIFDMGFGKGGGLGLHLAREILEVSGMHIRETGVPGQGARFEIAVPPDRWRS